MSGAFRYPTRITLVYLLVSALWIVFSDQLLLWFVKDERTMANLQTVKGWFFVFITAGLLYYLIHRSITALLAAERVRAESQHRYETLFQYNNDAIFVHHLDAQGSPGPFVEVNRQACAYLGYSREDLLRMNVFAINAAEHRDRIATRLKDLLEKKADRCETVHITKTGERIAMEVSLVFTDVEGLGTVFSIARDITERKRYEDALNRKISHLSSLNHASQFYIQEFEERTILEYACEIATRNMGADRARLELFEPKSEDSPGGVVLEFPPSLPSQPPAKADRFHYRKPTVFRLSEEPNEDPRWKAEMEREGFRSHALFPLEYQGHRIGMLEVFSSQDEFFAPDLVQLFQSLTNLTAMCLNRSRLYDQVQRHAEYLQKCVSDQTRSLREVNEELEAFTYSVSHDLRAPLRAMEGFSQALMEDYGEVLTNRGKDYARRIIDAAQDMNTLIEELLIYSRLNRMEIQISPIPLQAIIEKCRARLGETVRKKHAEVTVHPPLPSVLGNPVLLEQAVTNLLSNALTFVAEGVAPRIDIRAETNGPWVRLRVEDNGIGIEPEYHEKIFKVFERLHGVETYAGTGIGLAIVRKSIERLGGRVGVESVIGQGSSFWLELPLHQKESHEPL